MPHILLQNTPFMLGCIWWWLFSLLAFLLGWLLHWILFGRPKDLRIEQLTRERDDYHTSSTKWEGDYNSIKYQLEEMQSDNGRLRTNLQRCEADKAVLKTKLERAQADGGEIAAATAGFLNQDIAASGVTGTGARGRDEDLQIVYGIGPKTAELLRGQGYTTWAGLAAASPADLRRILEQGGERFRMLNPDSWPQQARLADEGRWGELKEYQKQLKARRE